MCDCLGFVGAPDCDCGLRTMWRLCIGEMLQWKFSVSMMTAACSWPLIDLLDVGCYQTVLFNKRYLTSVGVWVRMSDGLLYGVYTNSQEMLLIWGRLIKQWFAAYSTSLKSLLQRNIPLSCKCECVCKSR